MRSRVSRTSRNLVIVGTVVVAAILGAAALSIWTQRAAAMAENERTMAKFAQVLAEQTSRTIQPVDLTLREMMGRLMNAPGADADTLRISQDAKAMFDLLVERLKSLPQVDALVVVGADGHVANFSRGFPPVPLDTSGRDYYRHLSTHDDHALFIGAPAKSLFDGRWIVYLARRINDQRGQFAGIVMAIVKLSYLEDFYRAVTPEDGSVTALRRDGTILVRYPFIEATIGVKLPSEAPWYKLLEAGGGTYHSPGYLTGEAKLVAVHPMLEFPLVIDASTTEAAVLSSWRRQSLRLLTGAAFAAACVIFLLRVFGTQVGRLERSKASLARQNAQLENGRLQFDAVLHNISQGLTFFDRDQKLMVCNRLFGEIYRLPPDETRVGTSLSDILGYRVARGTFVPMTQAAYLARRHAFSRAAEAYDVTDELCDGRTVTMHYQPLPDGGWVTTHEDITERRRTEASLAFMARHDALTELPNRTLFQERLAEAIAAARHGTDCALLCIDLDRFKVINDTLGHPVGDGLLRAVAGRLLAAVRDVDTVARLGGDEFAVVQTGLKSAEHAAVLADRIIAAIRQPYDIDGHRLVVGASIGISMAPGDGASSETLLKNADLALYLAKTEGRGTYRFFEAKMDARIQALRLVEMDLRTALPADDFELHYQPILDLQSGKLTGFEALIRWNHPVRGLISPAEFIPIAEETGLIVEIGQWVLRTACQEAAGWPRDIDIAVNLSPAQFKAAQLFDAVRDALDASGLAPNRLVLEITESVLMQASDDKLALLHQCRALGIRIALDDFGTGYSSLSYLRSFPFDKIKIDQCFIRDVDTNKESTAIVGAIIGLARNLGIATVAEGVETVQQLATLREQGCTRVQGYLFSRPVPASKVPGLIRTLEVPGQHRPYLAAEGDRAQLAVAAYL